MKKTKLKFALINAYLLAIICLLGTIKVFGANKDASVRLLENSKSLQQTITVTGKITNADGEPLPGVNILIKGTSRGEVTNLDGLYSIEVADKETQLVFSFVGYLPETVVVGDQTVIDITMVEDITQMAEIVVTAFGIRREEKSLGYAVSTIDAKDITLAGNTNFASALYGRAAGVKVNASPGGASSAVNIQIRGATSINNSTQPLYIVDGVPIRNHALLNYDKAQNNTSFWDEQRIRENGILDINPEDIESLTVLKGASASALYGSQAANGVVMITTKKGSSFKKGLGIDVNYQYDFEQIAFQPDYQNTYGPGYDRANNLAITGSEEGWVTDDDGAILPYYRAYGQFGPKFDGRTVRYWDGTNRPYNAQPDNYKDFFDKGYNSTASVAITNGSDMGSYRFSYLRTDYKGIMPGFKLDKNYFNFNGNLNLSDRVSVNLISSYVNSLTHNRPYMMNQIFGSFSGFFNRMDDMSVFKEKYQTSTGYRWVGSGDPYNDEERLAYSIRATNMLDYFWTQKRNNYDEYQDRFINSATLNINLTNKLVLRGRFGNDFTSIRAERKEYNQIPVAFGNSGYYNLQNGRYNLIYGDVLVSYNGQLTSDLNFTLTAGHTGRHDTYTDANAGTNGGLVIENWFYLGNSVNDFTTNQISASTKKQAYMAEFGIIEFSYKDYLFLQGTGRYEGTSTLPPSNYSYFYPSFNSSFVFSDAINLPSLINYGKLRASWGIVGNHPSMYQANVVYSSGNVSPVYGGNAVYQYPSSDKYGNDEIKSERKYETEFGLEFSLFQNKIGLDLSYYNNKIVDQILLLDIPASSGATRMLNNVGNLTNQGFEFALNGTPVKISAFRWDVRFNYAINRNRLDELMEGVDELLMYNLDGGSVHIKATEGEPLGNIYVHPVLTNEDGEKVVGDDGLYSIDYDNYEKVGNVMPNAIGGISNSFSIKDITLNILIDYKFGGDLVSASMHYMTGAGMFESTLKYRDAEHGGLAYRVDDEGNNVLDGNGPYHDGIILEGVNSAGETNTTIVSAADYYLWSFGWGTYAGAVNRYDNAVNENSYIKMREVSLSYNIPQSITGKIGFQGIRLSLVGKNLFYIWKTLPNNWDPEGAIGADWLYQGIDQAAAAPTRSLGMAIRASF